MTIISNLTKFFEELTAQRLSPAHAPENIQYTVTDPAFAALIQGPDPDRLMFQEVGADDIDEDWPYTDEDYSSNMPCDFSGFCTGSNCPNFFKCQGSTK
jgi:hypothetical protein